MEKVTKRWATFWAPGAFVGENWQVPVESMDPYAVVWPDNAYAFVLCEREDIVDGGKTYQGTVNSGGTEPQWYYHPDSKVETLEQVKANPSAKQTLISNMECNGWDQIIWTRWGTWPQPFNPAHMTVLERRTA
ncbi:hypothetical protein [Rhodoferax sp. GW822-FHT02A01]|uniref:hypothetical protein n=1 Tax=Rhodoferax sp. GW822-FHT02A01 TaxID=3141537 RepID=UPI00315CA041